MRRDISQEQICQIGKIDSDTLLPSNWRYFISVRQQKRNLVNFISDYFLELAKLKFCDTNFAFVIPDDFDNELKHQACIAVKGTITQ